jgi:hypothetical protein
MKKTVRATSRCSPPVDQDGNAMTMVTLAADEARD